MMKPPFAEVLAQETSVLAAVTDAAGLDGWRRRLVEQVAAAPSVYADALRAEGDPRDRAEFVDGWHVAIAAALARVLDAGGRACAGIDVDQVATSILAALYGGGILSRVAQDPEPLSVSVAIALAPVCAATAGRRIWAT